LSKIYVKTENVISPKNNKFFPWQLKTTTVLRLGKESMIKFNSAIVYQTNTIIAKNKTADSHRFKTNQL